MSLQARALTIASATVAAGIMLILGILGNLGIYEGAVAMMAEWHMYFDLSPAGILAGMVEAAVITAVVVATWAWLYNQLAGARTSR